MSLASIGATEGGASVRSKLNLLLSIPGQVPVMQAGTTQAIADANFAALKAAVDAVAAAGDGIVHVPPGAWRIGGSGPILVDPGKCSIDMNGARLLWALHTFGTGDNAAAIIIRGQTGGTFASQMRNTIRNFYMIGPDDTTSIAILFDTPTDTNNARMSIEHHGLEAWGYNYGLGQRAYLMTVSHFRCKFNTAGVITYTGMTDAGENCSFSHGSMGGGPICVQNDGPFDLRFSQCSFDFPTVSWIRQASGSRTIFTDCHLEGTPANIIGVPIDIQGGQFTMISGDILLTAGDALTVDRLINRGTGSNVRLKDVAIYGGKNANANGVLTVGTGQIETSFITGATNLLPALLSNNLQDSLANLSGSGEVTDATQTGWCGYGGNATDRLTCNGVVIDISNTVFLSGTQSVEFIRGTEATAVARLFMVAPIDRMVGARTSIKAVPPSGQAAGSSSLSASLSAVQAPIDDNYQRPIIGDTSLFVTQTVTISDLTVGFDWTTLSNFVPLKYVPKWATHMVFSLNLGSLPAGYRVYIDRLFVTPF